MEKGNSLPLSLVARLLQLLQLSLNSINIINIIVIITMNIIIITIIPWKKSTKLYSRKLLSSLSLPRSQQRSSFVAPHFVHNTTTTATSKY